MAEQSPVAGPSRSPTPSQNLHRQAPVASRRSEDQAATSPREETTSPPISWPEEQLDHRSLLHQLQEEQRWDLGYSLAGRLHLERLIERFWHKVYAENRSKEERESDSESSRSTTSEETTLHGMAADEAQTSAEQLRQQIVEHPCFDATPSMACWPIVQTSSERKDRWSLGDEVMPILARVIKEDRSAEQSAERQEPSEQHHADDADLTDNPTTLSIVLRCGAVLERLWQALEQRNTLPSDAARRLERRSIVTWRDVLACLTDLEGVDPSVVLASEARLRSMAGTADVVPPAVQMVQVGKKNDGLRMRLRRQTAETFASDEQIPTSRADRPAQRRYKRRRLDAEQEMTTLQELENQPDRPSEVVRYLEAPPVDLD